MNIISERECIAMKIQAVSIDGFKNLSNVKISFDNITALVALNNFGKSNVLLGIDFGLSFIKASIGDKILMMANSNLIPMNKHSQNTNYRFDVEVLTEDKGREYRIQYGYEFSWKHSIDYDPEIVSEYLRVKLDEKGQKYTQLVNRTKEQSVYKSSETGRCSAVINIEPAELIINKLQAYDELYYGDIVKKLNNMKFYMETNLDAKNFYRPDPIIRKGIGDMMIDVENLPRIIYQLKDKFTDKYELLRDVYIQLFPDVEDFIVEQYKISGPDMDKIPADAPFVVTNAIYVLYVKDKNLSYPIDFAMMSDGAKRVFMILTKIILSSSSNVSLIAIEEPENSVHPKLFRAYIRIISQLLDDCKIIITSHSPYVVSYLEPSWIHVGINRKPGVAEFFTFKKAGQRQLQQDAEDFNMSMGDYLFSLLADSENNLEDYLECEPNE
jgi:predicted ATPase